jgi:hypothetical protein
MHSLGKLLSPARYREMVENTIHNYGICKMNPKSCINKRGRVSPEEERKDLMEHKLGRSISEHYSVPKLRRMLDYCSKIKHLPSTQMALVRNAKNILLAQKLTHIKKEPTDKSVSLLKNGRDERI